MNYAELRTTGFAFGSNCTPPADLVGGFVGGSLYATREVVQAERLYTAAHELDERLDLDREAYLTVYQYPKREYVAHVARLNSPKGYDGPAACCRLVWDVDRPDPDAALTDARTLARFVTNRYGESGFAVYFSGQKGYHLSTVAPPGFHPFPHVPAVVKIICLAVARLAGVRMDPLVYDHQRLFRVPNSRHPRSKLFKRFLDIEELFTLDSGRIRELARHPAGYAVPTISELNETLEADWLEAESRVLAEAPAVSTGTGHRNPPSSCPVVPMFVRDFIGFQDIQNPGRAVTVFKCAAALSEGFHRWGPAAVIRGLLEEVASKTGLDPAEVEKQIAAGIEHGRKGATT